MAEKKDGYSAETIALTGRYVRASYNSVQQLIGHWGNECAQAIGCPRPVLASAAEAAISCIAIFEAATSLAAVTPLKEDAQVVEIPVTRDHVLFYSLMVASKVADRYNPPEGQPVHHIRQAAEMLAKIKGTEPVPDWVIYLRDNCDAVQAAYTAAENFGPVAGSA